MLIAFAPCPTLHEQAIIKAAGKKMQELTDSQHKYAEHLLRSWRIFERDFDTAIGMIRRAARKAVQNAR